MPEMRYRLRWPDGSEMDCYSPSTIIQDCFIAGGEYALPDFLRRIREATAIASKRVRARHGHACVRAADQLVEIEARAAAFATPAGAVVTVVGFTRAA